MPELSVRLEGAERELAAIASVHEAHDLVDKAAAAAEFARRVKLGNAAINHATTIRLLAERRMAQLVDEGQAANQIATNRDGARPDKSPLMRPDSGRIKSTLSELDIDKRRLAEARKLARTYSEADIRDEAAKADAADCQLSRDALLRSKNSGPGAALKINQTITNEWHTPAPYVEAARRVLGAIDLDPASSELANQTVKAARYYEGPPADDGLSHPWKGRVWLNPPYGPAAATFAQRLVESYEAGDVSEAIALLNANHTTNRWFRPLWEYVLCFHVARIHFGAGTDEHAGATHGSVFVYLGHWPEVFREEFAPFGVVARQW